MDRDARSAVLAGHGLLDQFQLVPPGAELPAGLQAEHFHLPRGSELDWKRELVIVHFVKQKIAEVDVDRLWENTLPEVAATEEQLRSLEARLG